MRARWGASMIRGVSIEHPTTDDRYRCDRRDHGRGLHEPSIAGELNAAIARAVVGIYRDVAGRGPTHARAFFRDDALVVLMRNVLTKGERSLAERGRHTSVHTSREALQEVMRPDLIAAAERLTGGRVIVLMGSTDVDGDMAAQIFIMDRHLASVPQPDDDFPLDPFTTPGTDSGDDADSV
jgi:uncharacterized protein YbcI